jgi:ADP-ribose pyrophosphatase YjhB (NUDIX family)
MSSGNPPITRCPRCGSDFLSWPSSKHFECGNCGFVLYLNIASAVAVIMECQGRILFGVRKNDPGRGMLDLPGRFVDPGETAEEAVRREIKEELSIDIHSLRYLFSFPNKYLYKGIEYDTLDLIFLVRWEEPPEVEAADDLEEVLWVRYTEIQFDRIGFDSLRRAVRRYLESDF